MLTILLLFTSLHVLLLYLSTIRKTANYIFFNSQEICVSIRATSIPQTNVPTYTYGLTTDEMENTYSVPNTVTVNEERCGLFIFF